VFGQAESIKDSLNSVSEIEQVVDAVTEKREIKQLINQQLEKTKVLKNKLDEVKDDLFTDYAQDEDENMYPEIIEQFTSQQKEYAAKVSKMQKEGNVNSLTDELDNRINEIKRMRDGAEMDLDLDITQRMLENDERDVKNMGDVIAAIGQSCDVLDKENQILEQELAYYEKLLQLEGALETEEKKLNKEGS